MKPRSWQGHHQGGSAGAGLTRWCALEGCRTRGVCPFSGNPWLRLLHSEKEQLFSEQSILSALLQLHMPGNSWSFWACLLGIELSDCSTPRKNNLSFLGVEQSEYPNCAGLDFPGMHRRLIMFCSKEKQPTPPCHITIWQLRTKHACLETLDMHNGRKSLRFREEQLLTPTTLTSPLDLGPYLQGWCAPTSCICWALILWMLAK